MTTIVTRASKGSALTHAEMDANLTNLNSYKVEQDISGNATITGDVYLTGSGKRITGDFSNATVANRVMFQTSTANGNTVVGVIPNGTGANGQFRAINSSSDPANASWIAIQAATTESQVLADRSGTGTYLPMTFYTGGSERMRIDASGNVGIGTSNLSAKFNVSNGGAAGLEFFTNYPGGGVGTYIQSYNRSTPGYVSTAYGAADHSFRTSSVERMRIDTSGNVRVTSPAGLGYGPGAGGTVTQATSKSTSVTLNKPCGLITMNNAQLNAGTAVEFFVNNSLVASTDVVAISFVAGTLYGSNYTISTAPSNTGFWVILKNVSVVNLSDEIGLNFAVIKGATS